MSTKPHEESTSADFTVPLDLTPIEALLREEKEVREMRTTLDDQEELIGVLSELGRYAEPLLAEVKRLRGLLGDQPDNERADVRNRVSDRSGQEVASVTVEWAAETRYVNGTAMRSDRDLSPEPAKARVAVENASTGQRGDVESVYVVRREVREFTDGFWLVGPWMPSEPPA